MTKLSLLDQAFHALESNGITPVIMGGAMIFDPADSPFPLTGKIVAEHLAARLERIPLMRQKLVQDKLKIGNMRLVEDPNFNVRNHITLTSLPAPGGYDELTACLEDFSAQPLDMDRPLWHYEVIEGLESGKIAVATHIHHVILDGVGAVKALASVWDLEPTAPEKPVGRHWEVDEVPTPIELMRDAILENAERLYLKAPNFFLKHGSPILKTAIHALKKKLAVEEGDKLPRKKSAISEVRKTSINVSRLSPTRSVSYVEFSLKEVKALTKQIGCSINDMMLLLSSCALENYFDTIGEKTECDQVAAMPINIRSEDSKNSAGNVLTIARVNLHDKTDDLLSRLALISEQTDTAKRSTKPQKASGKKPKIDQMELLGLFSPIIVEALLFTAVKFNLLEKKAFVNLAVTNVPGSPVPIYLSGARIVSTVPMAPTLDTIGLTICISSMGDILSMGFHGCGEAILDKHALTEGASKGFEILKNQVAKPPSKAKTAGSRKKSTVTKAKSGASATVKPKTQPKARVKAKPKAKSKAPVTKTAAKAKGAKPVARKAPPRKPVRATRSKPTTRTRG